MKREALRHPKTHDLSARLNCSRPEALGYLILLFDWTTEVALAGNIGRWPDGAIARACDWTGDPCEFIDALVESGWVDQCDQHRLIIHDWADHCERWVKLKADKLGVKLLEKPVTRSIETTVERSVEPSIEGTAEGSTSRDLTYTNLTEPINEFPSTDGEALFNFLNGFIARWNSTKGTLAYNRTALSDRHRRLLAQIAPSEIEQALAKFPLKCGFKPTLGKFLDDGVVAEIIDGKYDWSKDAKPDPTKNVRRNVTRTATDTVPGDTGGNRTGTAG